MITGQNIKYGIYAIIAVFVISNLFFSDSNSEPEYEEVLLPSQGLATILKEVETDLFKIEDEQTLPSTEESIIVAKYMDGLIDTFTLAEARLMAADESSPMRSRSLVRAASFGMFGYMMGRSMSSPINSSAYVDQKTYNRVNKSTGSKLRQTATRTQKVKPGGKSGFGGGKSTRSYGG